MLARSPSPILSTLVALGALAACAPESTGPEPTEAIGSTTNLTLQPPGPIFFTHPWVGRQVKIRDWTGDQYDRCLSPEALPASNVRLNVELCYPTGQDALQWFTVIGVTNPPGPIVGLDQIRVSLQSAYNPVYCVDVAGGTANGGEALQLYPCHYGNNQRFHLPLPTTATGLSATGSIRTKNSNYAMALQEEAQNAQWLRPVSQRTYSATQPFQSWFLQAR